MKDNKKKKKKSKNKSKLIKGIFYLHVLNLQQKEVMSYDHNSKQLN